MSFTEFAELGTKGGSFALSSQWRGLEPRLVIFDELARFGSRDALRFQQRHYLYGAKPRNPRTRIRK